MNEKPRLNGEEWELVRNYRLASEEIREAGFEIIKNSAARARAKAKEGLPDKMKRMGWRVVKNEG